MLPISSVYAGLLLVFLFIDALTVSWQKDVICLSICKYESKLLSQLDNHIINFVIAPFFLLPQVCNLTWWTLSEDPQREIPLQKVSSISHRSSQGERLNSSLNINAAWKKTRHHVICSQTAAVFLLLE